MARPTQPLEHYKQLAQKYQKQIAQQRVNWRKREGFIPDSLSESISLKIPVKYQNNVEAQKAFYQKQIAKMEKVKQSYYYKPKSYYKVEERIIQDMGGVTEYEKVGKRKIRPKHYAIDDNGKKKRVNRKRLTKILNAWHRISESKDYNYNENMYGDLLLESTKREYDNMSVNEIEKILYDKMKGLVTHVQEYEDIEKQDGGLELPF